MDTHPNEIFVGGNWVGATGGRLAIVDPANEEVIGEACDASCDDVERAVEVARRAFDAGEWARRGLDERVAVLEKAMQGIEDRCEELARVQTAQMGAPIAVSRAMVRACSGLFQAYVEGARSIEYEYLRRDQVGQSLLELHPVGVVAAITPWNGPLATVLNKVIPALLAGCAVVLKPAPETPLEAGIVAELCHGAGLPSGLLNIVTGGRETGAALVASGGVDKVTFTGSSAAGRLVGRSCGESLKRVSLELGGKSAGVVLADADLDDAIPKLVNGCFFNSGQACIALTRVLVPKSKADDLVEALCAHSAGLRLGDPSDEAVDLGPLVTARQRDRVEGYIAAGVREGARLVLGGGRPPELRRGWYVQPTIFDKVTNEMTIAREEIFGPVMSVISYANEAEAVSIANNSDYGLHGAVFSTDPDRALKVARRIASGSVALNAPGLTPATPYGGVKGSGLGREHGREGVSAFLELHSYVVPAPLAETLQARGVQVA